MHCLIEGCHRHRGRYSNLCEPHRVIERRRGHPQQASLSSARLAPYRKLLAKHVNGPHGEQVKAVFADCWLDFVANRTDVMREYAAGLAVRRHELEAATELRGIADTVTDTATLFETITALFLLLQFEPSFFRDHVAFAVTLQRFVRRETAAGYDLVWNPTDQRYARKLHGLKAKAAKTLGQWLIDAFAGSCGALAVEIFREETRHAEQARQFLEALHSLKYEWRAGNAKRLPRPRKQSTPPQANQ